MDDIPNGQFICVYVGELLTDEDANDDGTQFGDEYLADLNFIELIEKQKEDYESECYQSDQHSSESQSSTSGTITLPLFLSMSNISHVYLCNFRK